MSKFILPLMEDNIDKGDIQEVIDFLSQEEIPKLTNGPKVVEFEEKWSEWVGVKHSLFVNSGSAANELTMLALAYLEGEGEIILPPLTWISDIASVKFAGFTPVFCDINLNNLSFDIDQLKTKITPKTKAIFLTHVLGFNGISDELLELCDDNNIILIEDVCESHGATFKGKKAGSLGFASNFSFYYAHHMTTIEGGMICTDDNKFYQVCRALRSHGMVREMTDKRLQDSIFKENPEVNSDFLFLAPSHNFRSTEINAVIGLSQIKKLDANVSKRADNFEYFMSNLDSTHYMTSFDMEGQSNYAFVVVLKDANMHKRDLLESLLTEKRIEFRRGLSGGGNQLKQPFFKDTYNDSDFVVVNYIHDYSWYIGNYPSLERDTLDFLLTTLNTAFEAQ